MIAMTQNSDLFTESRQALARLTPRDYQERGIVTAFRHWDAGHPGVLFRQPTGSGKTVSGTLIADRWLVRGPNYRVLVLAHERQLIQQFAEEIEDILGLRPAIEMADLHCTGREQIIVGSRATIKGDRMMRKFNPALNWLLIIDEAHRWAMKLPSCRPIIDHFGGNPNSKRLGLTATPERTDKTTFAALFPAVASDYRLYNLDGGPSAVNDGWAVEYDQRFVTVEGVDFKNLREVRKDFDEKELERVLSEQETLAKLVDPTLDLVGERRTLIFNPGVQMAKAVALYINAKLGYEAAIQLDGSFHDQDRQQAYRRHQRGDVQFLSVCGLCLDSESLILTDCGEVPIKDVTLDMRLWDGIEFVPHGGVIFKGYKPVLEYAGLKATEDHNVWTDSGWKSLAACKEFGLEIRVGGVEGKAVCESAGYYRGAGSCRQGQSRRTASALRWMRKGQRGRRVGIETDASWVQKLRQVIWRAELVAHAVSRGKEALRESERSVLQGLRRAWNQIYVRLSRSYGSVDHKIAWDAQGAFAGPHQQRSPLRSRQSSLGLSAPAGWQSPQQAQRLQPPPERIQEVAEVYDILNAGPRHRFTANGLIVSNCREGYNDPGIKAVAVYRPTKSRPLAEQMKGRGCRPLRGVVSPDMSAEERRRAIAASEKPNCMIIDLVGITGMADCASTAHILAAGKPDEVIERANKNALAKNGPTNMADEIRLAEAEIELESEKKRKRQEQRQKAKERRQAKLLEEQIERDEYRKRNGLAPEVRYQDTKVGIGRGGQTIAPASMLEAASESQRRFIERLGLKLGEAVISKKQASRIIGQLKGGVPVAKVRATNRIGAKPPAPPTKSFWDTVKELTKASGS